MTVYIVCQEKNNTICGFFWILCNRFAICTLGYEMWDGGIGGGYGYTKDYPLEKMMRNAQLNQILDGSNHSHQLAIAKSLFGDGFR